MRNYFYLNVNGLYGVREKNRDKLKVGLDDDCCLKNAENICKRIFEDEPSKYDAIFFAEYAPNTPSGKWVTDYFSKKGYKLVLPNAKEEVGNYYYSIVAAYVKKDLKVKNSKAFPEGWLTWNELLIDEQYIVGIHSTREAFLNDVKKIVKDRSDKEKDLIVFGDTNVTNDSEEKQKMLMNEIIGYVGKEIFDEDRKNTFRRITKPDRVFSNIKYIEVRVIDEFFINELADHDALSVTV